VGPLFEGVDPLEDRGGVWARERANLNDLQECFLCAGVTEYSNVEEFHAKRRMLDNLKQRVAYVPDTNLLYHGFLSKQGDLTFEDVVLVSSVQDEIEASLNYKYSDVQIAEMKRGALYQKHLVDVLRNRRMKSSRKAAYLALRKYRRLRDRCPQIDSVMETGSDKERNDVVIAKTASEYRKENPVYPVLLTCDALMTDICESEGLEHFLFKFPQSWETYDVDLGRLLELIRLTACTLGFLKVNNVAIIGEYGGKRSLDELRVTFPGARGDEFIRDLMMSRELVKCFS